MKKASIVLIIMISISTTLFSQKRFPDDTSLSYDPKLFVGTWNGISGNKSYEFEFRKDTISQGKESIELVLGSIKYIEAGKIIRIIPIEKLNSPLFGWTLSETISTFNYIDKEKGFRGKAKLTVDSSDKNIIKWELGRREYSTQEESNFDLPLEMILRKKGSTIK